MNLSHQQEALQQAMLARLYETRDPMPASQLAVALGCTPRMLWAAVRAQYRLGNLKRGPLIALTAPARFAIAAGRAPLDWRNAA